MYLHPHLPQASNSLFSLAFAAMTTLTCLDIPHQDTHQPRWGLYGNRYLWTLVNVLSPVPPASWPWISSSKVTHNLLCTKFPFISPCFPLKVTLSYSCCYTCHWFIKLINVPINLIQPCCCVNLSNNCFQENQMNYYDLISDGYAARPDMLFVASRSR